jgi:murein tripeptide amidase MpaA
MSVTVSSGFDSGRIEVVSVEQTNSNCQINVKVLDDPYTIFEKKNHKQWFHFRVSGCKNTNCTISIVNAGECSFPVGFTGYGVCTSFDRAEWFRTTTTYTDGILSWNLTPNCPQVYFAYFVPYSFERHLDLVSKCGMVTDVVTLGNTLDGRPIDMIKIGSGGLKIWAIARQHPGESMAEWWMEGYLNRLMDSSDPIIKRLLQIATFYVVPNMNPDGSFRGYLRTNASGANLNREWTTTGDYVAPTLERSPEVYHVLQELDRVGCDMLIDVHGDEALPYNFLSGMEGCPVWGPRLEKLQKEFGTAYEQANPDFQTVHGYELDAPNDANMAICSNQIAQRFDCLAFTLEMPFKDTAEFPDEKYGWSTDRSMKLGASMLSAISVIATSLR